MVSYTTLLTLLHPIPGDGDERLLGFGSTASSTVIAFLSLPYCINIEVLIVSLLELPYILLPFAVNLFFPYLNLCLKPCKWLVMLDSCSLKAMKYGETDSVTV